MNVETPVPTRTPGQALAERTRAAQGLPPKITDEAILRRAAVILAAGRRDRGDA